MSNICSIHFLLFLVYEVTSKPRNYKSAAAHAGDRQDTESIFPEGKILRARFMWSPYEGGFFLMHLKNIMKIDDIKDEFG
jgi:hypothetical protein